MMKLMAKTIRQKMYLHASKDGNWDLIDEIEDELGESLSDQFISNFPYALYEVGIDVEIDINTGRCKILAVNGSPLTEKVDG